MLKDLIVHLDGTPEDESRLSHAEMIAEGFGARITGLYTDPFPTYLVASGFDVGFTPTAGVAQLQERVHREGDLVLARLSERLATMNGPNELRRLKAGAGELPLLCVSEARWADLFVATAPYRNEAGVGWRELTEAIIFGAGHAVYLVPPGSKAGRGIRNVLVAWRDTRESARAVAEALPFLSAGVTTRIVTIDPKRNAETRDGRAADVAAHLDRHGAKVEIRAVDSNGGTVASVLLDEARQMRADLIVMGAYGHSRFREWILGGVTRQMITESDTPILMAH